MSGKGSKRRRENTALVEANWDSIFGKHQPAALPVLHGAVDQEARSAVGEGAAVLDVRTDGASSSGDCR